MKKNKKMKRFSRNNRRNIKRRQLLSKRNPHLSVPDRAHESKATTDSAFALKLQGLNKRVLAVVLAVALLLGFLPLGWFSLRGKADSEQEGLLHVTMSVRANGANNYTTADIAPGNISENVASAKFKNDLPANAQYYKSVMKDNNTGTETEIKAVSKLKDGSDNEKTYYAIDENATTGTLLKNGQELILVMAAKYLVSISAASKDHGEVTTSAITDSETSNFVWGGTDLRVQVAPHTDYFATSVTYIVGGQSRTVAINNNTATIPANDITNDITIDVNYDRVSAYNIYEVQNLSSSKYYPELVGIGNHGEITDGDEHTATKDGADPVEPGQTAIFYIYSESNTGGSDFVFNMLSINGVDIDYPSVLNDSRTTPFHEGEVKVTFAKAKVAMDFKNENADSIIGSRKRSLYKVEITKVHENLEVAFNFKENTNREIIIKGLRGIQQTAAVKETRGPDRYLHTDLSINDNSGSLILLDPTLSVGTRNYRLSKSKNNIYTAYYNQDVGGNFSGTIPSANVYFYRVKPGYNPYSVKENNVRAVYYDNSGNKTLELSGSDLLAGDNNAADKPDIVIRKASVAISEEAKQAVEASWSGWPDFIKNTIADVYVKLSAFDSEIRFWGQSDILNTGSVTQRKDNSDGAFTYARDLALTTIKAEERADPNVRWYAVPLKQNESNNQQLYLNATSFNYSLQLDTLDVNDVTFSIPSGYTAHTNHTYLETAKHTVEDAQAYLVTPSNVPSRTGYVFGGWQLDLLNAYGEVSGNKVYQSNEQVPLSNEVLMSATGDPTAGNDMIIPLKAVWQPIAEADTTKVRSTVYYQDITPKGTSATLDDKVYNVEFQSVETQTTDEYVAFLDTHEPDSSKYYTLNVGSHLEGYVRAQQAEGQYNEYTAIYDLKFVDLSLEKVVNGNISASAFEIKLKLTRPADYPEDISNNDIVSYVTANTVSGDDKQVSVAAPANEDVITYTKTFHNGDKVEFTNLPYGWAYEVVETKTQSDNFDTIIATEGKVSHARETVDAASHTGTLEENMAVTVNNQRAFDDPNIVSDKWLEKEESGDTYKLTMETYAVGATISDEEAEAVPLDIALVIDQSGSMGTADMEPKYTAASTPSGGWTVSAATSGTTYYYKVGEKYYPVQAQAGTIYEKVANAPDVQAIKGWGHDSTVIGGSIRDFITNGVGSRVQFNVPTSYYTIDANGKAHKVYLITVGAFAAYKAYAYYYTDAGAAEEASMSVDSPIQTVYWFRLTPPQWQYYDLYKTNNDAVYKAHGGKITSGIFSNSYENGNPGFVYWHNSVFNNVDTYWMDLAYQRKVCFVGQKDASIQSAEASELNYSWISNGSAVNNLYLPKDGTTYNKLFYVDDDGNKIDIGNQVYTSTQSAYTETLYEVTGKTRVSALQSAVTQFTEAVAQNAKEKNVDHKIGIIGFAGNKFPALSSGTTAYGTTEFDYTNSGLFLNNSFKNYETITGYKAVSGTRYINRHYYVKDSDDTYWPVYYRGGNWYYVDNGELLNSPSSRTFYTPDYDVLRPQDYQAALVEASQKTGDKYNGTVNANLTDAINHFANYGGTYTSYGIHMANQMLKKNESTFVDNDGNPQKRKRVIIVFTDGEPGSNGYSKSVADEALVDGNAAKYAVEDGGLDATVYTIGLFPGNASSEVKQFMEQLSSEYTIPLTKIYAAWNQQEGGSHNSSNNYGAGALDPSKTYYYTDDDGKTYAVTTQYEGQSSLGWWNYSGSSYSRMYPKTKSDDRRTINGYSVRNFYDYNGNVVYEENLNPNETYYTTSNTDYRTYQYEIVYEYRWYNSNNSVREPKISENSKGVQFFDLGTPKDNSDDEQYYYDAKNKEALEAAFNAAFELIKKNINGTASTLNGVNSFVRDVISEDFDWTNPSEYQMWTIPGTKADNASDIVFKDESKSAFGQNNGSWDANSQTLDVTGFDFGDKYIAPKHPGEKLRIVITGLKPNKTGGVFLSNTGASGVYKREIDENDQPVAGSEKLIDAFPSPSISRYKYTIDVDGDDVTSTWDTAFTVSDASGTALSNSSDLLTLMKHAVTENSTSWTDDGQIQNMDGKTQKSVILEEIRDVDQFETLLQGDAYKHGDAVPDNYTLGATVSGTGMNASNYTYTKRVNNGDAESYEPMSFTVTPLAQQDNTVHISSTEEKTTVTIREITQPKEGQDDFTDPAKEFDVLLTLKDRSGNPVAYSNDDVTFDSNGKLTLSMKHNDAKTFEIPVGYTLSIDVDERGQGAYEDTYRENGIDVAGTSYTSGAILSYTAIQVINSLEAPVITGLSDNDHHFGAVIWAVVGMLSLAAGGAYVYRKNHGVTLR